MCFDGDGAHCLPVIPGPPADPDYQYTGRFPAPARWIDRDRVGDGAKVAASFALKELFNPSAEGRFVALSPSAVSALQRVRDDWHQRTGAGLRITSGFRSPGRNAAVGGVANSRHTYGDAFDFKPTTGQWDQPTRLAMLQLCKAHGFNERLAYSPAKGGHVHCAMDPGQAWRDGKVGFDAWIVRAEDGSWKAEWAGLEAEGEPALVWRVEGVEAPPVEGLTFTAPEGASKVLLTVADVAFCEAPIDATGRIPCETNAAPAAPAPAEKAPASK